MADRQTCERLVTAFVLEALVGDLVDDKPEPTEYDLVMSREQRFWKEEE